jgi:hypothetical protein
MMKKALIRNVSAISLLLFSLLAFGGQTPPGPGTAGNPHVIPRTDTTIKVDGVLDEEAWASARVLELNYEISPRENVPPPVRTEILITYSQAHLYFGFRCYDPEPAKIRVHYGERDKSVNDDWVAVEIDTYNDSRRAFTLITTAAGVQLDGVSDAAGIKDYSWDMIYDTAARIENWGYGVEVAIPFSSLRFQRTKGPQVWGLNAVRGYPREQNHQIWARPYDRRNSCRVCQYMKIEGFEGASPGRNVEVTPTLTATRTDERAAFPAGGFSLRDQNAEAGLTARWGITPNLVLSGAVNPDFSQIEADAAQLDINQPFALFYPERRPFFTEGLDFFRMPLNILYTRTIRDPNWGIKLTGKEGKNAVGAYVLQDDITNLIFPGSQYSLSFTLQRPNTAGIFRYSRDFGKDSNLGAFVSDREGGEYFNRVYGVDGHVRFTPRDEIVFQYSRSSTRYDGSTAEAFGQPQGTFGDAALVALFTHKTRYHQFDFEADDIGKDFRADLGYMPQVGFRRLAAQSVYIWIAKEKKWWSRFVLINAAQYGEEQGGTLLTKSLDNSLSYMGIYQTTMTLAHSLSRQRYNGMEFNLSQFTLSTSIIPAKSIGLTLQSTFGNAIDYVNTRKGGKTSLYSLLNCNLGMHWQLNLSATREWMDVQDARLYTAVVGQTTIIYHLNRKSFLRAQLQYYDYDYNAANYLVPVQSRLQKFYSQVLFSYKLNPRTMLFLGYSDNYRGGPEFGLTQKDRTLFIKVGYAWVV